MPPTRSSTPVPWARPALIAAAAVAAIALLAVAALAAFPWQMLRETAARRLSHGLGRPVTIASLRRLETWSFHPTLVLGGVRAAQARWAGGGDLLRADEIRVRFPALPLLAGHFRPEAVDVRGLRLDFARDRSGHENWHRDKKNPDDRTGRPYLRHLTVRDATVIYRDAKRDRSFTARLDVGGAEGFRLSGTGKVRGEPVTVSVRGASLQNADPDSAWPFRAVVEGPAVGVTLDGRMDHPLDAAHFTADATGHATDLKLLDAIIEAGLPGSQPVQLCAHVRRDRPGWKITGVSGTMGRSDIAGSATIARVEGRHRIDAVLTSRQFDFDDLSSNAGRARAAAKRQKFGRRLVPDTAIDLDNVARSDGVLRFDVARLLWPGPSPFRSLRGTITVDHSRLTVAPLTLGLTHGRMTGHIGIDQRRGGDPRLDLRLETEGARLADFIPDTGTDAALSARVRLSGPGRTVRAAVGRSSGSVALVARGGTIPARTASLLGQDIGRALFTKKGKQAELRCAVMRLEVTDGSARPAPLLIDTSRALTTASGRIELSSERLALSLSGVPKRESVLRIAGAVPVGGTIKAPQIVVPEEARSLGGILKSIGRALSGKDQPIADDADCDALARRALR